METPEERAAREAAEDEAATGGFDDDVETEVPAATPEPEEEVEAPEGARDPDAVKNLIKAERNKAKQANARARELEARLREAEAAQPQESAAEKQAREAAEAKALKLEVALDKGLSKVLALRLQGSTREEVEADADALLAEVGTRRQGGMDGGYRQDPPPSAVPPEKAHNNFIVGLLQDAQRQR